MELTLNQPGMEPFEPGKDLKVVMACEDSAAARRAGELLARLGHHSQAEGRLIYSWWNFDVLAIASLRKLAAGEAATAGMIIIAAHDGPKLPAGVADWTRRWLAMKAQPSRALVALLDARPAKNPTEPGIVSQLKQVAASGHMDFFATHVKAGRAAGRFRKPSKAIRLLVRASHPARKTVCRAKRKERVEMGGR